MATQSKHAFVASAADNSITGRIAFIRQMQTDLRTRPVTGSLGVLKKFVYKAVRSAFCRQFNVNSATVDLVEALYRETEGHASPSRAPVAVPFVPSVVNQTLAANNAVAFSTGEVLASCGQTQDQAKLNNIRPLDGFNSVYTSPAEMRMPERVALYSLIFGMQPRNCLEIGTFRGGSSAIICGAMNDTGYGQLACVDPIPKIEPQLWSQLSNRCRLFEGPSPDILTDVAKQVNEPFDFALIDANHTYDAVRRDIAGVLPYLADQAYLLFHDANYPDVRRAIDESVASCSQLTDCGLMSVEPTVLYENGQNVTWAGLRLLKYQRPVRKAKAA
ncbi:MAG: class I SAM-dependent methyltransferase [Planctomycetes bacterium]|nr:class I SAM-dependent methyltransferase [Planctomycetota bacterium]